jgi:predicted nucleic acid-binding protein
VTEISIGSAPLTDALLQRVRELFPKAADYDRVISSVRRGEFVTSVVVLYEVYRKMKKVKGEETALEAVAALNETKVVPIDQTLSLEAADYSLEHNLHFADALIYATARSASAELYTSDEDLKPLKDVVFI